MKLKTRKLSKRTVDELSVEKDTVFWDSELSGFGVRVYPSGGKHYVVQARERRKAAKRVTVGRHGVITADEARKRAAAIIARIKAGEEAMPETEAERLSGSPAVGRLARRWLEQHVEHHCKPKTRRMYRLIVEKHLLPVLGKTPALAVNHRVVADLHHSLRKTPTLANHAVRVLSRIWRAAEARGELPEGKNPCRKVPSFRENRRERYLSESEFIRLGEVLSELEAGRSRVSTHAIAAIRLLMLTGCRKNEILALEWKHVDLEAGELGLPDSKTGSRTVVLSPEAVAVLSGIPKVAGNPHVIPGKVRGKRLFNLDAPWNLIRGKAGLEDVRVHDLRHSFASKALALGESLPSIGKLLGHSRVETTARYAHLSGEAVREAAVRISDSIATDIVKGYCPGA
ncbi:MAG: tyrosine-type recombinase/integrase [Gammaproteobacteria bacterium]|nr:tyrosine-type recombinase/integrase [Gammaproteobacteria bacterium]